MSEKTHTVAFVSHLPGLSIEKDAPFLYRNAELRKLSFEQYEILTAGAHDREDKYNKVGPVFCVTELSANLKEAPIGSKIGALEMKIPSALQKFGGNLPSNNLLHDALDCVMRAWKCLSLACPMTGLISPRHSVTFLHAQAPGRFFFQGRFNSTIQIQGDADHEYVFGERFAARPISLSRLAFAEEQGELIDVIESDGPLKAAFSGLLQSQEPALSGTEHAILCAVQLEELLIGERVTNLRQEFSRRAARFIPADSQAIFSERHTRALYDLRSAYLHGRLKEAAGSELAILALAPALLSSVIRSFASAIKNGAASSRELIDSDTGSLEKIALQDRWETTDRFRIDNRFSNHRKTMVVGITGSMGAPENKAVLWSPLIGFETTDKSIRVGRRNPEVIMPLSLGELFQIEDREIRQDFFGYIRGLVTVMPEIDEGRSVLMTLLPGTEPDKDGDLLSNTHESVHSTIIALRALGFHSFCDPQLLGDYHYIGRRRIRRPMVFRQTVLNQDIKAKDVFSVADMERVGILRDIVLEKGGRFPSLRRSLNLFRKSFFKPVLPDALRARLSFAFIESALGRFHAQSDQPMLEDIVGLISPGSVGIWFKTKARTLRNRLAHSLQAEVEEPDLSTLLLCSSNLAERLIQHMSLPEANEQSFGETFRDSLAP